MHATSLTSNFAHFDLQKWLFLWKSVEGVAATCAFWSSLSSHFQVMVCRALWHILILDQRKGNREHKFLIKVMFFFLQKKVIVCEFELWSLIFCKLLAVAFIVYFCGIMSHFLYFDTSVIITNTSNLVTYISQKFLDFLYICSQLPNGFIVILTSYRYCVEHTSKPTQVGHWPGLYVLATAYLQNGSMIF